VRDFKLNPARAKEGEGKRGQRGKGEKKGEQNCKIASHDIKRWEGRRGGESSLRGRRALIVRCYWPPRGDGELVLVRKPLDPSRFNTVICSKKRGKRGEKVNSRVDEWGVHEHLCTHCRNIREGRGEGKRGPRITTDYLILHNINISA